MNEEIEMTDLFEGDEVYEEQTKEAKEFERLQQLQKFVGYKLVNSCQNCLHQEGGYCHLMEKYGQAQFPVCDLGKCKHFMLDKSE